MKLKTLKPRVQVADTRIGNRLPVTPRPSQRAGYRIRGRKGQRIRAAHLWANPLCVMCLANGRVTPATEVDHVIPLWKGGADDGTNYQSLCEPDHAAKTAREAVERARVSQFSGAVQRDTPWIHHAEIFSVLAISANEQVEK